MNGEKSHVPDEYESCYCVDSSSHCEFGAVFKDPFLNEVHLSESNDAFSNLLGFSHFLECKL